MTIFESYIHEDSPLGDKIIGYLLPIVVIGGSFTSMFYIFSAIMALPDR